MPQAVRCPSVKDLQRLAQGQVSQGTAERLGQHLVKCNACRQTLQGIESRDTLVSALRNRPAVLPRSQNSVVDGLVEQMKQLCQAPSWPAPEPTSGTPSPRGRGPELIDFLSPAQGPNELGRLGGYRVLEVLGIGGMGVVFKAEDPQLKRLVALKAIRPSLGITREIKQRFLREAQATAALKHDNIVTIYQVGEARSVPFLAMEFLEGESLDQRLKKDRVLPIVEVLRIGRQAAEGLAAAHARGLIHRDIKPANLWLEAPHGRVKVLDFGLARITTADTTLTEVGTILGTPAYMAPEQSIGQEIDHRCDLFSLGVVLYQMCTGQLPFQGRNPVDIVMSTRTQNPKPPQEVIPELPRTLSEFILLLLAKNPTHRPPVAQAVVAVLQSIEDEQILRQPRQESGRAHPVTPPRPPSPAGKSRQRLGWLLLATGAAVFLATVLTGILLFWPPGISKVPLETHNEPPSLAPVLVTPMAVVTPLFNGKDLSGWDMVGGSWSYANGTLIGKPTTPALPAGINLCSQKTYRDFELKFQVRLKGDTGSAGIQIRSRVVDGKPARIQGPECVIGGRTWGGLWEGDQSAGRMTPAPASRVAKVLKPDDFNDYSIRCVGKHVTIKVNGETTIDDDVPTLPDEGIIAWHLGGRSPSCDIVFRNIDFAVLSTSSASPLGP